MKQIKKFSELNKASKVRRINKIRRHTNVPGEINELYNEYMNTGKNEGLLFLIREILLNNTNGFSEYVQKLIE